jgi:outer membrane protein
MRLSRIIPAFVLCAALPAAQGADLVAVYRDALVSDPVFLSARAAYQAGQEKYPGARLPTVNGNAPRSATT